MPTDSVCGFRPHTKERSTRSTGTILSLVSERLDAIGYR